MFKRWVPGIGLVLFLLSGCAEQPGSFDDCVTEAVAGTRCALHVKQLRPTRFALGQVAVGCDQRHIERADREQLADWLREWEPFPVVIGPDGAFYLVGNHHPAAALLLARSGKDWADEDKRITLEIKQNHFRSPGMESARFWSALLAGDMAWLRDDKGLQPMNPQLLPKRLDAMLDDPYRTLSRWVRESCGYLKNSEQGCGAFGEGADTPFLEFHWADYFRERVPMEIPDSPACRHMPYAGGCLPNQISALAELYPKAMEAALSLDAKRHFEYVGLNPAEMGFNPSGRSLWVDIDQHGCERVRASREGLPAQAAPFWDAPAGQRGG